MVSFAERRIMKNLSKFSTVLMAVYTILLILADLRLFSVSAAFGHMSKSITGWIIDGADLSVIAGTLSISVSVLILIFAVVFLFFLHCLCDTYCALLLAYPQKKIQSRCLDENCCFWLCIGGLHQACFVLGFHSAYTAGCTFSNCGFWRKIVFGSCCLFENKSPAI